MTKINPTTAYQVEQPDESPCCGVPLELVSPPLGYECRECGEEYTLDTAHGEQDYPTNDDGEPLCTGMDDGQCSRTVAEPGGTCFQH